MEPKLEMEGIDFELRLADLELCKLGTSEMDRCNLGEARRSQSESVISSLEEDSSLLSSEFPGDVDEYLFKKDELF